MVISGVDKHSEIKNSDCMVLCKGPFYKEPTNTGVYTHFQSCLQSTNKFGTAYTLPHIYFWICSSWTKLDSELLFLKHVFLENG